MNNAFYVDKLDSLELRIQSLCVWCMNFIFTFLLTINKNLKNTLGLITVFTTIFQLSIFENS